LFSVAKPFSSDFITFEEYGYRDYVLDNRATMASVTDLVRLKVAPKRNIKKKSFALKTLSNSAFISYLSSLCPKLFYHHQLERVQRQVFTSTKSNLQLGHLILQMDFAENLKLILLQQRSNESTLAFLILYIAANSFQFYKKYPCLYPCHVMFPVKQNISTPPN